MSNRIKGVVYECLKEEGGTSQRTGNTWRKLTFSIIIREWNDAKLAFEIWGDDIDKWRPLLSFGNEINVDYAIESRRVESDKGVRYYTTLKAIKVVEEDNYMKLAVPDSGVLPQGTSAVGQLISQHMDPQPAPAPAPANDPAPAPEPYNGLPF